MNDASIFKKAQGWLARFCRADSGNVAVLFGIAIVPIMVSVGAAVDYARVNNARTAMQAALDTAALMISKDVTGLSASEVTAKAQTYFNSLYKHPEAKNVSVNATYTYSTSQGSKVVVTGSATMATDFMKVVGIPTIDFGGSSTTVWGMTKLRVALALDNTGSMASAGKMTELKKAAKDLIDTLKGAAKVDGDVYVSIVPFAVDVNIGKASASANWLRWDLWEAENGSCSNYSGWGGQPRTKSACLNRDGDWTAANRNNWNGCITDRDQNYDVLSTIPTSSIVGTLFPVDQADACPAQIMPLSYDWSALKTKVDSMNPSGGTNQPIGMAWAWLSLLQQAPFNAPPEDPNFKYNKVVILLSDGDNTIDRWYGNGSTPSPEVDARQKLLCDNAKNAGIQIFTIQVNTNNDNNSSVMSYCASGTSNFFPTTSSTGINDAFQRIGGTLSKLRIAK